MNPIDELYKCRGERCIFSHGVVVPVGQGCRNEGPPGTGKWDLPKCDLPKGHKGPHIECYETGTPRGNETIDNAIVHDLHMWPNTDEDTTQ